MSAQGWAAAEYARRGWPVFPCRPGGKEPMTPHGFYDASTCMNMITRWWTSCPSANVAIRTGAESFDALDVDVKPDGDGFGALDQLSRAGLILGAHRLVSTPSGGRHLYFRPGGNGCGSLRSAHLDVRGNGGYLIAPPSVVKGVRYVIQDDRPEAVGKIDWAACRRLLDPPRPPRPHRVAPGPNIDGLVRWMVREGSEEGGRNNSLYWAACKAAEGGCSPNDLDLLIDAGVAVGLSWTEAACTVRSASRGLI